MKTYDPNKLKYFKRLNDKIGVCDFCDSAILKNQRIDSLSTSHWNVLVCKYPYLDGNIMIIPVRHVRELDELNNEEWMDLKTVFAQAKKKLGRYFKTKSFNIGLNIGKNAGASLEHLHWQLIPRSKWIPNSNNLFANLNIIMLSPPDLKKILEK